jgi:hypothetical protein
MHNGTDLLCLKGDPNRRIILALVDEAVAAGARSHQRFHAGAYSEGVEAMRVDQTSAAQ